MRAGLVFASLCALSEGAVQMPNWFGDNMVIQTNEEYGARGFLNGKASPGEKVVIQGTATNTVYTVTADSSGDWEVMLDPQSSVVNKGYLTVQGESGPVHKADQVSYGDVFFCSGQSNMAFPLKDAFNATAEASSLTEADFANFRFFTAPLSYSPTPQFNFNNGSCQVGDACTSWVTAAEAHSTGYIMDFSAVCYMTVRDIARFHTGGRPMGLVLSAWGGTRIEAWMPESSFKTCSSMPPVPATSHQEASVLYNAMVAPVNKMAVRSAIWYQGEANADEKLPSGYDREAYYSCYLQAMVSSWRDAKRIGDFAFLAMQLPPSVPAGTPLPQQNGTGRPAIRLAEADLVPRVGSKTDISGIAVGIDLGGASAWGIDHPPNKNEMSRRLALQTVHVAYAVQGRMSNDKAGAPPFPVNTYFSGPVFEAAAVTEGAGVLVSLMNGTGFGMSLRDVTGKNINGSSNSCTRCCQGGGAPFELEVGGKWVQVPFAGTKVVGDKVSLTNPAAGTPTAVRYASTDFVECILQNGDGLPMGPFSHSFTTREEEEPTIRRNVKGGMIQSPPMGFNSWNFYHCNIDEVTVKAVIDVMVSNGMQAAGYEYVNIDDCWQVARMPNGTIIPDPVRFPSGMKALADYAHSKGMKFGVYTAQTQYTCQNRPGAYKHEMIDGKTYCDWGIDYLKIDNCKGERWPQDNTSWIKFHESFEECYNTTGHFIVQSVESCDSPTGCGQWIPGVANLWRTSGDVQATFSSVMHNINASNLMRNIATPGHFNDADMLEVGDVGLSYTEQVTHFSLWCIMASPLLAGTDLIHMPKEILDILANKEVINVNQDLGLNNKIQGYRVNSRVVNGCETELWFKPLRMGTCGSSAEPRRGQERIDPA
eukprot:TRINITY_DN1279_c0_g2_i1.p1 TRINITY_DN1279_c0_g2~~TRINITY_DN1279_c0_g2_i1.p1  ORF type:complete len:890 (+),score=242.98 TRINITY_DN1279_c0_g2_i1:48-2672(+)